VEVKIGIQSVPRELIVDTDASPEEVEQDLVKALSTPGAVFAVTVRTGGRLLVPADKVAFLEFGVGETRRVGFA
jgi:hypothetical protein